MSVWWLLGSAIVVEVIGTLALKMSDGFSKLLPTVIMLVSYLLAFYLLSLTLKHIPVGVSYAIWSGVGIALITLASWILFKQQLDLAALIGIAMIVGGVIVMQVFSKTTSI